MTTTVHQQLTEAGALAAWEPLDGHAIVTCKIRSEAPEAWETRVYEFVRKKDGWLIDTNPGFLRRESWEETVDWFCRMRPIEIDLLTTV
jgi:hypothetical protein